MPDSIANAFLTGSRVYGEPTEKSDTDLVVLVDQRTFDILCDLHLDREDLSPKSGGNDVSASLRFGKLNLIVHTSEHAFNAWAEGTDNLIVRGPVTREEAVRELKAQFAKYGISRERACP
jgi:hypothetical protein